MSAVRSVRQKLVGMVLLSTLAALLLALAAMAVYDLRLYHRDALNDLVTQAELVGRAAAPALAFDDARAAKENLELLRYRPKVHAAALYNARGRLFASYATEGHGGAFPALPEADGATVQGGEVVVFKRLVAEREIVGTVYLRAGYELWNRLLAYVGIAALVGGAAMLLAYALSQRLQRALTGPIESIAAVAREVTEKRNFALRAEKLSADEIGRLAEAFNTMLAEIERATRNLEASGRETERELAERRRAEEEILRLNAELEQRVKERTQQLEFTNAELESFCYSVSHDLRAPLRSIDGFSQALIEDFGAAVPEDGQRYLARIRAATQRMGQLIEDLLNLSRVSRGTLARTDADLSQVARQVAADLKAREPARQVELVVWDGVRANADARLVRAALENLLGNAWKFTGKREQARIEFGSLRDGGRITYYVRDNGAGFDMAYAHRLFGAFQRLHSGNDFAGTGIGLATVQRIVHRHGGRIWADAQPGQGAAFYFTLEPDAAANSAAAAAPVTQKVQAL